MTADFSPLFIGMVVVLGFCALGLAFHVWVDQFQAWSEKEAQREAVYRKRFSCPSVGKEVEVGFLTPLWQPENLLAVVSCSAFKNGGEISCDKSCLSLPQAQQARTLFPPPFFPAFFPPFP
jgi:hypothetical protein